MKRMWIASAALAGLIQAEPKGTVVAWFPDGAGLEIYTESTGHTQLNPGGEIGIGPGPRPKQDIVDRVVVDSGGNILFAYNLEGSRGAYPDTVTIRILPLTPQTERDLLGRANKPNEPRFSGAHVPTVSAVREFLSVKMGQGVTLDILQNPSTGEKIYDVLRPMADPPPSSASGTMMVTTRAQEVIALKEIALTVNGQPMRAPPVTITGTAARLDIPGHGSYTLAAYDPKNLASTYTFRPIGHADGNTLRWAMDGDDVEISSRGNVLTQAVKGVLWVYHNPGYRSQDQPDTVVLRTAGSVEWLLPKK
jgi:hypothetical protein